MVAKMAERYTQRYKSAPICPRCGLRPRLFLRRYQAYCRPCWNEYFAEIQTRRRREKREDLKVR